MFVVVVVTTSPDLGRFFPKTGCDSEPPSFSPDSVSAFPMSVAVATILSAVPTAVDTKIVVATTAAALFGIDDDEAGISICNLLSLLIVLV